MSRLVLVEHAPASLRPEPNDVVVALTPEACYELDRRGLPYRLTTEFGIEAELSALEPLHWQDQLRWIDAFDELIAAHVPETQQWRFGAATSYAYYLKRLMDPVRIRALELDSMLGSCDRVLLHRRAEALLPVSEQLWFEGPSVTSLVLPLVVAARGIVCEERVDEEPLTRGTPSPTGSPGHHGGLLARLKAEVRRRRHAWRSVLWVPVRARTTRLTLLFADDGYDLAYLLPRARKMGHRCLRVVDDTVAEDGLRRTEVARLPVGGESAGWASAAEAVASPDHPLWEWPNGWLTGAPLADLLRPRIIYWLRDVMPGVAARAAAFDELLEREDVDFVLGANLTHSDVVAAAAVTAPPAQSVLVDHGYAAFVSELYELNMLRYVGHNFCPTTELAEYMESRRALHGHPSAEIQVGSYQWRANASMSRSGRPPHPLPVGRPVVVYVLAAIGGNGRYLNRPWYSESWYYRLCREVVDVLARHPEIFSVVKLHPAHPRPLRNAIDLYVEDLGLDHVVTSKAPLRAWIPWADRIVFDWFAMGLCQTAAAGIPYLALLYTHHRYRSAAVERLGRAAVHFTEPAEAARAVEAFVAAPTVTAPRLFPEGEEILTTLERLARR